MKKIALACFLACDLMLVACSSCAWFQKTGGTAALINCEDADTHSKATALAPALLSVLAQAATIAQDGLTALIPLGTEQVVCGVEALAAALENQGPATPVQQTQLANAQSFLVKVGRRSKMPVPAGH